MIKRGQLVFVPKWGVWASVVDLRDTGAARPYGCVNNEDGYAGWLMRSEVVEIGECAAVKVFERHNVSIFFD